MATSKARPFPAFNRTDGVFLVFLTGKLFGFLTWSWWWVFSPYILLLAVLGIGAWAVKDVK